MQAFIGRLKHRTAALAEHWYFFMIGAGLVMAVAFWLSSTVAPTTYLWLVWGTLTVFYALYWLHYAQNAWARHALLGLMPSLMAGLVMFGLLPTLMMLGIGTALTLVLWPVFIPDNPSSPYWRSMIRAVGRQLLTLGPGIVTASAVYHLLGGPLPLTTLTPAAIPALGALFITAFLVQNAFYVVLRVVIGIFNPAEILHDLRETLVNEALLLAPIVILAVGFYEFNRISFGLLVIVIGSTGLIIQRLVLSRHLLGRHLKELGRLNTIGEALAAALSPEELFQAIYEQLSRLMDAPVFYVAVYDKDQQRITFPLVMINGERVHWPPRPLGAGATEHILRFKTALMSEDGELRGENGVLLPVGDHNATSRAYLGVPILSGEDVFGVLAVQHPTRTLAYTPADRQLLHVVAAQTAIALRNDRLLAHAQRLTNGLVTVNTVSGIINASLDVQHILRRVCQSAIELTKAPLVAVFLKSEQQLHFSPAYSINLDTQLLSLLERFTAEQDHPWVQLLDSVQFLTMESVQADPMTRWLYPLMAEGQINALTIAPFTSAHTVTDERTLSPGSPETQDLIGFLVTFYRTPHTADSTELNLLEMLANQGAVAIENAALFTETQHAVQRLAYMAESTRLFTNSLELDKVAHAVTDWVVDALDLDAALLLLWRREEGTLQTVAYARGDNAPLSLKPPARSFKLAAFPELADALRGQWARLYEADESALSAPFAAIFQQMRLNNLVLTPLSIREDTIGLIVMGTAKGHRLTTNDIGMAEAIANQAATAIQNAQFYNLTESALADRMREMDALEAVLRDISASVNETEIISRVLAAAHSVTRAEMLGCILTAPPSREHAIYWRYGSDPPETLQYHLIPADRPSISGRVIDSGEPMRLDDVQDDSDYWLDDDVTFRPAAELCVPILYEDRVLGALNLESSLRAAFTDEHQRFMQNLAGHAAIALERARLFASNQRQIDILDSIRRLSLDLLEAPDMGTVLDRVCDAALYLVNGSVHLYFYDELTDELTFAASLLQDGRRNVEVAAPRPDGLTRRSLAANTPIISSDISPVSGVPTRLLGIFPLRHSGLRVGVMNVGVDDPALLGDNEARALELLANQAAIAIERARLSESRSHQIEILEGLHGLSAELLNTPRLDAVLRMVCRSTMVITTAQNVHLYFYDGEQDALTFAASLWRDGRQNVEVYPPGEHGVTRRAAQSGAVTVIHKDEDPRLETVPGVEIVVGIPLKHAAQVVGVLNIAGQAAPLLEENQVRALELLANQAAVSIRSVRLYEAVREGRDRMRAILDTVYDGLALVDHRGYLMDINPAAERYLGEDIHQWQGRHVLRIFAEMRRQGWAGIDPFNRENLLGLWEEITKNPYRNTHRRLEIQRGDTPLILEETSAPVLTENNNLLGRLFVWHDISQQELLEQSRVELTNTIVHDLRSPLTAIKGGLDALPEFLHNPADAEFAAEIVKIAQDGSESMLALVESLLDVARMDNQGMPLELATQPVNAAVDKAVHLLDIMAKQDEITLETALAPGLPPITADQDKLRRILINLLDNAVRFTPKGGRILIEVDAGPTSDTLLYRVTDSGPGIPPEARDRVFDRFATGVTGAPRRGNKGLGLGLAFCKLAVEAHGGRIWVEDGKESGAAFCFVLPIAPEVSKMQAATGR